MILDTLITAPGRRGRESRGRLVQEGDTSSSSHTPLRINLRGRCRVSAGPVPSLKGFSCKTASWNRNPSVSSLLLKDPSVWKVFILYLTLPCDRWRLLKIVVVSLHCTWLIFWAREKSLVGSEISPSFCILSFFLSPVPFSHKMVAN